MIVHNVMMMLHYVTIIHVIHYVMIIHVVHYVMIIHVVHYVMTIQHNVMMIVYTYKLVMRMITGFWFPET